MSWCAGPDKGLGIRGEHRENDLGRVSVPQWGPQTPVWSPDGRRAVVRGCGGVFTRLSRVWANAEDKPFWYVHGTHMASAQGPEGPPHHWDCCRVCALRRSRNLCQSKEATLLQRTPATMTNEARAPSASKHLGHWGRKGSERKTQKGLFHDHIWDIPWNPQTTIRSREVILRCQWQCQPGKLECPSCDSFSTTGGEDLKRGAERRVHPKRKSSTLSQGRLKLSTVTGEARLKWA